MKRHLIYIVVLFCMAIVCSCHRRYQYPAVLQQADSLCVANPDSAFLLLDSLHYRQPMTKKELARYALLLAKATDKTYQSLIPCDSLLNFALDYYKEPTADRATALLYKGCLEDEVNHDEDAIKHLQEARLILQNYPEEVSTRRITLGLLGDLYYQHKYFKDCLPVYQEALELCETDVDKSIAYQDIASYYTMTEKKDSALYYHHFALQHANKDKDSLLIANEYHYLGLCHNVFSQVDSALYYEKLALDYIPTKMPKGKIYYQIGSLIRTLGNTDQAAYYMGLAKEDSVFNSAYMVNRVLGKIETERGNYKEANELYIQYVEHLDSLYTAERSVDVQQLVYEYNTRLQVKSEQIKSSKRISIIILVSSLIVLFALSIAVLIFFRKRKQQLFVERLKQVQEKVYRESADMLAENNKKIASLEHELEQMRLEGATDNRKEAIIRILENENENLEVKLHIKESADMFIHTSLIRKKLRERAKVVEEIRDEEWKDIESFINTNYPEFLSRLQTVGDLNKSEYRTCLLLKCQLSPSEIAALLNLTSGGVANIRRRLSQRILLHSKNPSDWDQFIHSL